jgi:hypothetical protein
MKSYALITSIWILILGVSIHPSINKLKAFSPEASISLLELFNLSTDSDDVDGNNSIEIEEIEKEVLSTVAPFEIFFQFKSQKVISILKVFIPTYLPSIFIPPSL